MVKCSECPECRDAYPGELDRDGFHFHICGKGGNIVYTIPHREKRFHGNGYIEYGIDSCGIYKTVEDVLQTMTKEENERWRRQNGRKGIDEETL